MARVNAFLVLCRTGRPNNAKYVNDNDLLHKSHPKYSGERDARYDPNQPRDDDGKFGQGGGGGADNDDDLGGGFDEDGLSATAAEASDVESTVLGKQEEYVNSLEPEQIQAISEYTGEGYRDINKMYRGAPPPPLTDQQIAELDLTTTMLEAAVMEAPPLAETVTVYRGMTPVTLGVDKFASDEEIERLVGNTFKDQGFVSTTFNPDVTDGFGGAGAIQLEIKAPRGTVGLAVGNISEGYAEMEFIMPPGTEFNITGFRRTGRTKVMQVEVIS
jgi:hypothetical protein